MIGSQASGDGALDLLAVQRDNERLDLLAARVAVQSDDDLVRLLVAWRDEVDDGLPSLVPVPAPRSAPDAVRTRTPAAPAAARPATDLLPAGGLERSHRRRLTATGTAAALVLGGTLSLSGVAAAVTGDPLAPYRAVGHAFSIGGDSLPEHAADVAQLNKRLTRARAAVAHGDVAGAQAAVDEPLTAQLDGADLTDQQRGAIERRLASLRSALARAAAAEAERGRSENRATAVATPPPHGEDGRGADAEQGDGTDQGADTSDADSTTSEQTGGSTTSTKPDGEPALEAHVEAHVEAHGAGPRRSLSADEDPPAETADQVPTDPGDNGGGGDQSAGDQSGDAGRSAGGRSSTQGRSAGTASAATEPMTPEPASWDQAAVAANLAVAADIAVPAAEPAARAAGGSADRR